MNGFTLVEILIGISIIVIISIIIFLSLSTFRENQLLKETATEITSLIHEARLNTLASRDDSAYGVHFETGKAVLFKGGTYSAVDPNNIDYILHNKIEISLISLFGSGSEANFKRLSGEVPEYGDITIRPKNNITKTKIITIYESGAISDGI